MPRITLLMPVGVALALAACGPAVRLDQYVQDCASVVAVSDHTLADRYTDRGWIGVAFTGPAATDPVSKVTVTPGDLSFSTVDTGGARCRAHVKKLKPNVAPPAHLGIDAVTLSSIQRGETELLVIMVGPAA
jgi:hypothetical protein